MAEIVWNVLYRTGITIEFLTFCASNVSFIHSISSPLWQPTENEVGAASETSPIFTRKQIHHLSISQCLLHFVALYICICSPFLRETKLVIVTDLWVLQNAGRQGGTKYNITKSTSNNAEMLIVITSKRYRHFVQQWKRKKNLPACSFLYPLYCCKHCFCMCIWFYQQGNYFYCSWTVCKCDAQQTSLSSYYQWALLTRATLSWTCGLQIWIPNYNACIEISFCIKESN